MVPGESPSLGSPDPAADGLPFLGNFLYSFFGLGRGSSDL